MVVILFTVYSNASSIWSFPLYGSFIIERNPGKYLIMTIFKNGRSCTCDYFLSCYIKSTFAEWIIDNCIFLLKKMR